jgi:uncharacterized protein GlcG (DUF336 family)
MSRLSFPCTHAVLAALVAALVLTGSSAGAQTSDGRITLSEALQLIEAATAEATKQNYRLSFAVVDARGDLIAVARMPGAGPGTPDTAIGKAMTSTFFGQPSGNLAAAASSPIGQALNDSTGGRLRFFQGGLPIVRNGFTVGAMGASGATAQQDEDVVKAALSMMR